MGWEEVLMKRNDTVQGTLEAAEAGILHRTQSAEGTQ